MEDSALDRLAIKLASVTRVEAHKRRGAKGQTEHVDSYLRKVLDSFDGPGTKTKKGFYNQLGKSVAPPSKPDPQSAAWQKHKSTLRRYQTDAGLGAVSEINTPLRGIGRSMSAPEKPEDVLGYAGLHAAVEAFPAERDLTVYRGGYARDMFGEDEFPNHSIRREDDLNTLVGKTVTDQGFMSTSEDYQVARGFVGADKKNQVILDLNVPKGTPAVPMGDAPWLAGGDRELDADPDYRDDLKAQKERLLDAGTRYTVTKVTRDADGLWHVHGDVVPPGEEPKPVYPPLTRDQFSDPTTERTRAVSSREFQELAAKGADRLADFHDNASPPKGLDDRWDGIKGEAWDAVQDEWGGITVDTHTGKLVTGDPNQYALTVRPAAVSSVRIPVGSDQATFDAAMEEARKRFASVLSNEHYHLGVFRDDAISSIDIDPVLVLDEHDDVESIGAYAHSEGGAYNFSDGLGYWPPYVDEGLDDGGAEGQAVQGLGRVVQQAKDGRGPP